MIAFKDIPLVAARLNRFSPLPADRSWELTVVASGDGVRLTLTTSGSAMMDLLSDPHHVIDLPWSADLSFDGLYAVVREAAERVAA